MTRNTKPDTPSMLWVVQLAYFEHKPSPSEAEKSLRACMAIAIATDPKRDMLGTAFYNDNVFRLPGDVSGLEYRAKNGKVVPFGSDKQNRAPGN